MDSLFQSFNQQVSMNNFAELSGCVFSWIEEQCKPGDLQVAPWLGRHHHSLAGPDVCHTEEQREGRGPPAAQGPHRPGLPAHVVAAHGVPSAKGNMQAISLLSDYLHVSRSGQHKAKELKSLKPQTVLKVNEFTVKFTVHLQPTL